MHRCADLYNPVKFTHFNEKNITLILKQLVKVADKWSYELSQEWLFPKLIPEKVRIYRQSKRPYFYRNNPKRS